MDCNFSRINGEFAKFVKILRKKMGGRDFFVFWTSCEFYKKDNVGFNNVVPFWIKLFLLFDKNGF